MTKYTILENSLSYSEIAKKMEINNPSRARNILNKSLKKILKEICKYGNSAFNEKELKQIVILPNFQTIIAPLIEQAYSK